MQQPRQWYYLTSAGEQVGPMDFAALREAAEARRFGPEDLVWQEGDADWQPAGQVAELFPDMEPEAAGQAYPPWFHGYAGFWRRVLAFLLDSLLLSFVFAVVVAPLLGVETDADPQRMSALNLGWAVVNWLYFALLESSSLRGTLGKLAVGIEVTDMYGRQVSFLRATGRHFGKILSGLILGIGFLMAAFTARKQALHDILADCLVVKREP